MKVKITPEMKFLNCFDQNGNLLGTEGDVIPSGNFYTLRIGNFKQTISANRLNHILEMTQTKEQPSFPSASVKEQPIQAVGNDDLTAMTKKELVEIAKSLYAEGQIDARWGEEKLIKLIKKARG